MELPLPLAIEAVGRAATTWRRTRLRGGDVGFALAPHRDVTCRAFYRDLTRAADHDAVARAACPWVAAMTLDRVLAPDAARLAEALEAPVVVIERPVAVRRSPSATIALMLAEPSPELRRELAAALCAGAVPASDAARILTERRAEAARLLDDGADVASAELRSPSAAAVALAGRVLDATHDLLPAAGHWADAVGRALCREGAGGWPARLSARWLDEILAPLRLTDGLALELPALPDALGAASFARALRSFGVAIAQADIPRGTPLCAARAPRSVLAARRGALLASLPVDRVFSRRVLGLSRPAADAQVRHLAQASLISLRLDAARVLLCDVALAATPRDRADRFTETTARALGAAIAPSLLGVLPALGPDDPTVLLGSVLAARDRRRLVEDHDEDWFRNPRAGRSLREEQQRAEPLEPAVAASEIDAAVSVLLVDLQDRLG